MSAVILPTDSYVQEFYNRCMQMEQLDFDLHEVTRIVLDGLSNYHDVPHSFENYVRLDAFQGEPGALTQPDCDIINEAMHDYYHVIFNLLVQLGCYDQMSGANLYPYFTFYGDALVVSDEPLYDTPRD